MILWRCCKEAEFRRSAPDPNTPKSELVAGIPERFRRASTVVVDDYTGAPECLWPVHAREGAHTSGGKRPSEWPAATLSPPQECQHTWPAQSWWHWRPMMASLWLEALGSTKCPGAQEAPKHASCTARHVMSGPNNRGFWCPLLLQSVFRGSEHEGVQTTGGWR